MSDTQTLLVAIADGDQRDHVAGQFDADGHTVYTADCAAATIAKLATVAADALVLGPLQHAAAAPALLRELRAGTLNARVHPAQPVITLGDTDDLTTLRAYDAGSDHHLALDVHYLVVRAVLAAVARRTNSELTATCRSATCTSTAPRAPPTSTARLSISAAPSSSCSASSPATRSACSPSSS